MQTNFCRLSYAEACSYKECQLRKEDDTKEKGVAWFSRNAEEHSGILCPHFCVFNFDDQFKFDDDGDYSEPHYHAEKAKIKVGEVTLKYKFDPEAVDLEIRVTKRALANFKGSVKKEDRKKPSYIKKVATLESRITTLNWVNWHFQVRVVKFTKNEVEEGTTNE